MTRVWYLLLLAGCQQLLGFEEPSPFTPDDAVIDSSPIDTIDAPRSALCERPSVARRVLCFPFEGDMLDRSGNNNHANASGQVFGIGVLGQGIDTTFANITVPDSATMDVTSLTIRMWIKPAVFPTNRFGLLENNRYRLHFLKDGSVRCALNDGSPAELLSSVTLTVGQYARVTCDFDGTRLRLFFDGTLVAETLVLTTI